MALSVLQYTTLRSLDLSHGLHTLTFALCVPGIGVLAPDNDQLMPVKVHDAVENQRQIQRE